MVTLGLWHYRSKDFQRMCFHFLDEIRGYVYRVEVRICIGKDINKHSLKTVIDGIRSYYVPWFVCEVVPSMWWVKRCCIHFWCMDLLCQFSQGFSSLVMLWMERSLLHPKICGLLAPVVTLGFRDTKHVLHENEFKAVWRLQFSVESIDFLNEMWLYRVHFSFESVVRLKMLSRNAYVQK